MNYSADTEMDLDWAADQMRRAKHLGTNLGDQAIRRATATRPLEPQPVLKRPGGPPQPLARSGPSGASPLPSGSSQLESSESSLGTLLSAITNTDSAEHVRFVCEELLSLLSDRDRVAMHGEFVELHGVETVIGVVRKYADSTALPALRILDKLSRTSARVIATAGGIDVVIQVCERGGQAALVEDFNKSNKETPLLLEAALKTLHGLTFDDVSRGLLSRHTIVELAEALLQAQPGVESGEGTGTEEEEACAAAWGDVLSISRRLLQRLGGSVPKPTAAGRQAAI